MGARALIPQGSRARVRASVSREGRARAAGGVADSPRLFGPRGETTAWARPSRNPARIFATPHPPRLLVRSPRAGPCREQSARPGHPARPDRGGGHLALPGTATPRPWRQPHPLLLFGKGRNRFSSDACSLPFHPFPGAQAVWAGHFRSRAWARAWPSPESPRPGADEVQARGRVLLDDRHTPLGRGLLGPWRFLASGHRAGCQPFRPAQLTPSAVRPAWPGAGLLGPIAGAAALSGALLVGPSSPQAPLGAPGWQ